MLFRSVCAIRSLSRLSTRAQLVTPLLARNMSIAAQKRQPSKGNDARHNLKNTLSKEVEAQADLLKSDLPSISKVTSEHKSFLQATGFAIQDDPASPTVRLTRQLDADTKVTVVFDVSQVVQRSPLTDDDHGDHEDNDGMDYDDHGGMDGNVETEVQVERRGVDRKLVLQCELDVGYEDIVGGEEGSADNDNDSMASVYITDARLMPIQDTAHQEAIHYEGPDYTTLDETLQEHLSEFVEAAVGGDLSALSAFIDDYAGSKEGAMYERWLSTVRDIVA